MTFSSTFKLNHVFCCWVYVHIYIYKFSSSGFIHPSMLPIAKLSILSFLKNLSRQTTISKIFKKHTIQHEAASLLKLSEICSHKQIREVGNASPKQWVIIISKTNTTYATSFCCSNHNYARWLSLYIFSYTVNIIYYRIISTLLQLILV